MPGEAAEDTAQQEACHEQGAGGNQGDFQQDHPFSPEDFPPLVGSDQQQFHRAGAEFGGDHAACQHHEDQRDQADGGYGGIQQPQEGIGFHRLGVVFQPFFRYADVQLQFFFSVGVEEAGVILSAQQTEAVSFDAV